MHMTTECRSQLPRLAWVAQANNDSVRVLHGSAVETGPEYVVEGVWDEPFHEAGFHKALHFFGSGIRIDEGRLWIVPSHALVDRLFYCRWDSTTLASNSLALLLAFTGAELDPTHNYAKQTTTILKGVSKYEPEYPVRHPQIRTFHQVLHFPRVFDSASADPVIPSVPTGHGFRTFEEYRSALAHTIVRLHANLSDKKRAVPVDCYTMASSGYDSTCVSTLVRDLPIRACYTAHRSRRNILPLVFRNIVIDDGTPVARALGLPVRYFDRPTEFNVHDDEIWFYTPSAHGCQLTFGSMARQIEGESRSAVLFTGFHGDKVWDRNTPPDYLGRDIKRGDVSGLDLSEIRLRCGFVNVAVPFMFAEDIADLVRISNDPEMAPWQLNNDYDRPIPRRITEGAGVPRTTFGRKKKAVLAIYRMPLNRDFRREFLSRLSKQFGRPAYFFYLHRWLNLAAFRTGNLLNRLRAAAGRPVKVLPASRFWREVKLPYELHLWAIGRLREEMKRALGTTPGRPVPTLVDHPPTVTANRNH